MDSLKGSKLNQLLQHWPPGAVAPMVWLKKNGISRQLLGRYEEYNWVTRIAKGVALRKGDTLTWQGVIYGLQKLQELHMWIGGKSALEMKGLGHYVVMRKVPTLWLYSSSLHRLPKWIFGLKKIVEFRFQHTSLFSEKTLKGGFSEYEFERLKMDLSSPERAILELLEGVPSKQTFEESKLIFENLTTLRKPVVQSLLESCTSIKAKRLFCYFAEECGHSWFSKLNLSKVNLGKGKRAISPKGHLNAKYQILIPRSA